MEIAASIIHELNSFLAPKGILFQWDEVLAEIERKSAMFGSATFIGPKIGIRVTHDRGVEWCEICGDTTEIPRQKWNWTNIRSISAILEKPLSPYPNNLNEEIVFLKENWEEINALYSEENKNYMREKIRELNSRAKRSGGWTA